MQPNWQQLYNWGFSVFGLPHGSKDATWPWRKYQSERCSEYALEAWQQAGANAAIATGKVSGVFILDIDSDIGEAKVAELGVPITPTVQSSKGRHLYFKWPGFAVRNARILDKTCDIKGDGGCANAAGSLHPSGVHYTWLLTPDQVQFADAPEWLLELAKKPPEPEYTALPVTFASNDAYAQAALNDELDILRNTSEGGRDVQLNLSAFALGQLVAGGLLDAEEVRQSLYYAAAQTGLPHKQIISTMRSGLTAGQRKPRGAPEPECEILQTRITVSKPTATMPTQCTSEPVQRLEPPEATKVPTDGLTGVLAQLVEHLNSVARKQQPVLALGASLCVLGALIGRNYKTDYRSNLYVVGIAGSGEGKNDAKRELKQLLISAGLGHYIGPDRVASASGLLDHVRVRPSTLLFMDEFGHTLSRLTDKNASQHVSEILHTMTDLYTTSDGIHSGTAYSMSGKIGEPPAPIDQPNLSIYGICTPDQFWSAMTSKELVDGSVARMLIMHGCENPPRNKSRLRDVDTILLQQRLQVIAQRGESKQGNLNGVTSSMQTACKLRDVPVSANAQNRLDDYYDALIEQAHKNKFAPLLHRRNEMVGKLALILAVSDNAYEPRVTLAHVDWSIRLVDHCSEQFIQSIKNHVADNHTEANHKRVLKVIRDAGVNGLTGGDFARRTQWLTKRERSDILDSLVEAGQATRVVSAASGTRGGRPSFVIVAVG